MKSKVKKFENFKQSEMPEMPGIKIDYDLLDEIMIDFVHMGLDYEITINSSIIIKDFEKFNNKDFTLVGKEVKENLIIDFYIKDSPNKIEIKYFEEALDMVSNFLHNEYGLKLNYIYVRLYSARMNKYFKDIESIKKEFGNNFLADHLAISFY